MFVNVLCCYRFSVYARCMVLCVGADQQLAFVDTASVVLSGAEIVPAPVATASFAAMFLAIDFSAMLV